jgi:hypothetical protein
MLLIPTASQDVEGVGLHQDDDAERTQERVKKPNLPATSSSALSNILDAEDGVSLNESSKVPEGGVAVTQDGKGVEVEVAKMTVVQTTVVKTSFCAEGNNLTIPEQELDEQNVDASSAPTGAGEFCDEDDKEVGEEEDGEEDEEEEEDGDKDEEEEEDDAEKDLHDDDQEMGDVTTDKEAEEHEGREDDIYDDDQEANEHAEVAEKDEDEKPMTLGEKFWNFFVM